MKIRTRDGDVFHINEHHVIHLYRAVNRDRIGSSTGTHVVLLSEFSDWNGLAEKAVVSKAVFTHDKIEWKKAGTELFPSDGDNAVRLTGPEIQALASYLNDDVDVAIPKRERTAGFSRALAVIEDIKRAGVSTVLDFQWPNRFASGVTYKAGSTGPKRTEHFVWGPGGHVEYPHIHCFVRLDGTLYEAQATLKPLSGEKDKRHFKFLSDLTVPRAGTLNEDDAALTMLEKTLKAVVYGEDMAAPAPVKPPRRRGKGSAEEEDAAEEVVVPIDAHFRKYAQTHDKDPAWVARLALEAGIVPEEIHTWEIWNFEALEDIEV
ncbi:hypothetical protein [Allokutzneria sp. NRRL B-24872]|uniref:hypothetical protein n=1 Tax=Allokutzneria sp. NRRL B-24872 TaxID=1137961 RepID=UPI000A36427A|nr:hypothetical protein [Allokutzneria sp. NRRL B-24872]